MQKMMTSNIYTQVSHLTSVRTLKLGAFFFLNFLFLAFLFRLAIFIFTFFERFKEVLIVNFIERPRQVSTGGPVRKFIFFYLCFCAC